MRVLFVTPILEHPAAGGPQLRIENSIKALSEVSELDIIYRAAGGTTRNDETRVFFKNYCNEFQVIPRFIGDGSDNRNIRRLDRIFNRVFDWQSSIDADFILDHVKRRKIDILWFGYGNISYPLIKRIKSIQPRLKVVCDTDSVWSRFILRELPYATGLRKLWILGLGRKKRAEEREWVNLCDVTTAVSEVDADYYRDNAIDKNRVHLFSNVIDIAYYRQHVPGPEGFNNPSIYLAGSFGRYHSPMDVAARWMLEEVFPLVLKKNPDVHFYIVGRNSELGFGHLNGPNITVTGRLESVLPYLCNVDVALVPLKFESGTRFKILEAGACKTPLVSTCLGAEGIPVKDGEHVLIADETEDFANAIINLIEHKQLATKIAQNCHNLVCEQYSIESLVGEAKRILEYLQK